MAKPFPKSVGFLAGAEGNSNDDRGVVGDDLLAGIGDAPACSPFHPDAIARAAGTSGEGDDLLKRPRDVAHQDLHTFSSKQVRDTFGNGGLGERERERERGGRGGRAPSGDCVNVMSLPEGFRRGFRRCTGHGREASEQTRGTLFFFQNSPHMFRTFPRHSPIVLLNVFGRAPLGEGKPPVHLREMM